MRFPIGLVAMLSVAGCGDAPGDPAENRKAPPGMASEITVELPPPAEPARVKLAGPAGRPESYTLGPPQPQSVVAAWAGVLRKNNLPCDRITSARPLQGEGGRTMGIYKIQCAAGGTYRGTRRDGRLRFRRWTA